MPTIYVDRPFRDLVREEVEREKRERRRANDDLDADADVHVPESTGLERLLSDDAERRLEKKRDQHP